MKPQEFVIWLDGFLENNQDHNLSEDKIEIISKKLSTVFTKVTPSTDNTKIDPVFIPDELYLKHNSPYLADENDIDSGKIC